MLNPTWDETTPLTTPETTTPSDAPTWDETTPETPFPKIKTQAWQEPGAYLGPYSGGAFSAYQPENMEEAVASLTTPNISLPTFKGETPLGKVAAGIGNVLGKGLIEPPTSPFGAALLGGAASPVGRAALAAGYGIPMIREGLKGLEEQPDFQRGVELSAQALLGGAMLGLPKGELDAIKTRFEPESDLIQHPGTEEVRVRPETGGGDRPLGEPAPQRPEEKVTPTVTETTPPVPEEELPATPTQTGLRPAIRLVGGKVVTGDAGTFHADIIKSNNLKAEEIDQRGFVNEKGEFTDREQAAQQTQLPTQKEPERLHSTDLPEAKTSEQGPGTIGKQEMGAAGVEELPETGTGLKNAIGELERAGLGLHDAPETVQRNMAQAWGRARVRMETDPGSGERLAQALIAEPDRGLTDDESALLLRYKVDLFNRMNDAAERTHTGDEASQARAETEHQNLLVQYGQLLDAVKQRGAEWGREGRWRQAMSKEDFTFSSADDINRFYKSATGRDLPPDKMEEAQEVAGPVKESDTASNQADTKLHDDIDRKAPRSTPEEIERQKPLDDQAKAARRALDAASKTVRENAVRIAQAEAKKRVAKTVAEKETADIQLKAQQKALDAADKAHRDAARALADAERKLRGDPMKSVWVKVREQLDKGEKEFEQIRTRVAAELGMKVPAVTRIMARDATTKRLMDDAWVKQQEAQRLRLQAKAWVLGIDTPEMIKYLKSVPKAMFGLKVFGHGFVPLGTHAPLVAFDPRYAHIYYPAYRTMYKMVLNKAFYQDQVNQLQQRANYITAKRSGLINDPRQYEDYTSPDVVKYITGGTAGARGFTILKILRQDMFDREWNRLPKSLQTDAMAREISSAINHITGVVTDPSQLKGRQATQAVSQLAKTRGLATALFAPRLEASRVATLLLDPMRATWILTKQLWDKSSPEERHFAVQQLISKTLIAGTLYSLLQANKGMLSALGSKQQVNTSDPMKSDFLKFKVAGMDFAYGNAMLSMMRMPLSIYRVVSSDGGRTKSLVYADEGIATVLWRFGRTQLSPFMGTFTDLGIGSDYASRPLPRAAFGLLEQKRPVPKRLQAEGLGPYSWPEYWSEQMSPIPGQEAIKEFWRYGFGMDEKHMHALEKALAISTVMGATGGRLTEDVPPRIKSPLDY